MRAIREWLEGEQEYAAGVALYAQQPAASAALCRCLAAGETAFTRRKLVQALRDLAGLPTACNGYVTPAPEKAASTTVQAASLRNGRVTTADPQRRAWFAERNYLHPQLELVATDEERRVMALRILELGRLISRSYDAEAGRRPATQEAPPPAKSGASWAAPDLAQLSDGERLRLLLNLRSQRAKLKKRPDRADDLARVEAAIDLLEQKP